MYISKTVADTAKVTIND